MFSIGYLMKLVLLGLGFVHIFVLFQIPVFLRQVMRSHRLLSTELRCVKPGTEEKCGQTKGLSGWDYISLHKGRIRNDHSDMSV